MSEAPTPVLDLPQAEPRLPRFAWLLCLGGVALAVAGGTVAEVGRAPTAPAGPAVSVPAEAGRALFVSAGCTACHDPDGRDTPLAPGLVGVAARATERIASSDYRGDARSVTSYLEEAVIDHCADTVPGYDCAEASDTGLRLSMADASTLVRYLLTLGGGGAP